MTTASSDSENRVVVIVQMFLKDAHYSNSGTSSVMWCMVLILMQS